MLRDSHLKRGDSLAFVPPEERAVAAAALKLLQTIEDGTTIRRVVRRCDRCHEPMPSRRVGSYCECGSALVEEVEV